LIKRLFDLFGATLGLVLTSPILLAIALAIGLSSPGPVIHTAKRVGLHGETFTLYKFRTMIAGASHEGPAITRAGDPRVTRVGNWLRNSKLDELPQLLNVLKGDMSLVGPRPEDPRYVEHYSRNQKRVLELRPGIFGLATLEFRDEESILATFDDLERGYLERVMPQKLDLDLIYVDSRSFLGDLRILFRSAGSLLKRR
jgi:lipopolysaccharide/colanic/teichoic acid biosynthesis glycosyltransferase